MLASVEMLTQEDGSCGYSHVLHNVIPSKPLRNVPTLLQEHFGDTAESICQRRVISLIWELAGKMVHLLRYVIV